MTLTAEEHIKRTVIPMRNSVTVTTSYTMTTADRVIRCDCTSGALTITLPSAFNVVGEYIRVIKIDTSANAVTVNVISPDTIGPSALTTFSLTAAGQVRTLRSARNGNTVIWDDIDPFIGTFSGNASSASKLTPGRNINGVAFDGTTNITVTAAAGTLTGTTLNATVVTSSLTSVGTLTSLSVAGTGLVSVATGTTLTLNTTNGVVGDFQQILLQRGGTNKWRVGVNIVGSNVDEFNLYSEGPAVYPIRITTAGVTTLLSLMVSNLGGAGGLLSVGAANSGGAGFRLVLVPN